LGKFNDVDTLPEMQKYNLRDGHEKLLENWLKVLSNPAWSEKSIAYKSSGRHYFVKAL